MVHSTVACCIIAVVYVAPFYIWRTNLPRNHPHTIRARMLAVFASSMLSWLPLYHVWRQQVAAGPGVQHPASFWHLLGFRAQGTLASTLVPLAHVALLYLGPLVMAALQQGSQLFAASGDLQCKWPQLATWRNLVVAPLTEEFVFRACMLPLLLAEGYSPQKAVLVVPLFFGVAHLHHVIELISHQGMALKAAIPKVGLQFCFTTLFGWYAAYMLLQTGHLAAPIAVHVLCNAAGLPDFAAIRTCQHSTAVLVAFLAGLSGFALTLPLMKHTRMFDNQRYAPVWLEQKP